jgi:hypothetical protein
MARVLLRIRGPILYDPMMLEADHRTPDADRTAEARVLQARLRNGMCMRNLVGLVMRTRISIAIIPIITGMSTGSARDLATAIYHRPPTIARIRIAATAPSPVGLQASHRAACVPIRPAASIAPLPLSMLPLLFLDHPHRSCWLRQHCQHQWQRTHNRARAP